MPTCRWFLLLVCLLFGFGISINANVIDFETGSFIRGLGQAGITEGFSFTTGGQANAFILTPASCIPSCISDGTQTLGAFNGATVTVAPILPVLFAVDSFDVAGTASSGSTRNATSIKVIGNLFGGGQVTQIFAMDPSAFQTLTLNSSFINLSSVEFDGLLPLGQNSPEFQLDNITYSSVTTPEPASIAFLATILLSMALATAGRRSSMGRVAS
jgi:hypothetical protein